MEVEDPGGRLSEAEVRELGRLAEGRTKGWTVWRQDDSGNQYVVSRHDTQAEAQVVAADMEARGHKQVYWVALPD